MQHSQRNTIPDQRPLDADRLNEIFAPFIVSSLRKNEAARHLGRWRPDTLFQCRCSGIGIMHRDATDSGEFCANYSVYYAPNIRKQQIMFHMVGIYYAVVYIYKYNITFWSQSM
jgi:hypothetical protein